MNKIQRSCKLERNTTLFAVLGMLAIAFGCGCEPDKTREHAGTGTTEPTNAARASTGPGGLPGNRVLRLNGKTASVRIPDSPSLHSLSNNMTLELWFKAASFYKQSAAVNSLLRKNVEAGSENFFLRFRIMGTKPAVEMSAGHQTVGAPFNFEPGTWYHLAGTCDGKMMTAFVNGEAIGSQRFTGPIEIDDSDLLIGKGDPSFSMGEYFHGHIDEIRIWNIARSPDQIRAAMRARLTGKEPGLMAYWPFDDGSAKDFSQNGNNGILDGEAQVVEVSAGGP